MLNLLYLKRISTYIVRYLYCYCTIIVSILDTIHMSRIGYYNSNLQSNY